MSTGRHAGGAGTCVPGMRLFLRVLTGERWAENEEFKYSQEFGSSKRFIFTGLEWRRGWDSNPRAAYATRRFRGAPVTTTSVPLPVRCSSVAGWRAWQRVRNTDYTRQV